MQYMYQLYGSYLSLIIYLKTLDNFVNWVFQQSMQRAAFKNKPSEMVYYCKDSIYIYYGYLFMLKRYHRISFSCIVGLLIHFIFFG